MKNREVLINNVNAVLRSNISEIYGFFPEHLNRYIYIYLRVNLFPDKDIMESPYYILFFLKFWFHDIVIIKGELLMSRDFINTL